MRCVGNLIAKMLSKIPWLACEQEHIIDNCIIVTVWPVLSGHCNEKPTCENMTTQVGSFLD